MPKTIAELYAVASEIMLARGQVHEDGLRVRDPWRWCSSWRRSTASVIEEWQLEAAALDWRPRTKEQEGGVQQAAELEAEVQQR